jgi:hypothetical protein
MSNNSTLLSIDSLDFSDYATRGITCALRPEQNGTIERDWNGNAVVLTIANFRKYQVTVSCTDQEGPPFADVWRGDGPYTVRLISDLVGGTLSTDNVLTLSMYVQDWSVSRDEWGAETGWQLDLVEA